MSAGTFARVVEVPRAWEPAGSTRFGVRPLTGGDELACPTAPDATLPAVVELLDAVTRPLGGGGREGTTPARWSAWRLALPTRDRLLAELYRVTMGSQVEQRRACEVCGAVLQVRFDLDGLLRAARPKLDGIELDPDGRLHADGVVMRVPRCEDLLVCNGPDELAMRCVEGPISPATLARADAVLERAAPLLDADLDTTCEDCEAVVPWRFVIADHVVRSLGRERPVLMREIDLLARTYRWSLDEILRLPRTDRHHLVALAVAGSERAS